METTPINPTIKIDHNLFELVQDTIDLIDIMATLDRQELRISMRSVIKHNLHCIYAGMHNTINIDSNNLPKNKQNDQPN